MSMTTFGFFIMVLGAASFAKMVLKAVDAVEGHR